jgi:hypothetical protein
VLVTDMDTPGSIMLRFDKAVQGPPLTDRLKAYGPEVQLAQDSGCVGRPMPCRPSKERRDKERPINRLHVVPDITEI